MSLPHMLAEMTSGAEPSGEEINPESASAISAEGCNTPTERSFGAMLHDGFTIQNKTASESSDSDVVDTSAPRHQQSIDPSSPHDSGVRDPFSEIPSDEISSIDTAHAHQEQQHGAERHDPRTTTPHHQQAKNQNSFHNSEVQESSFTMPQAAPGVDDTESHGVAIDTVFSDTESDADLDALETDLRVLARNAQHAKPHCHTDLEKNVHLLGTGVRHRGQKRREEIWQLSRLCDVTGNWSRKMFNRQRMRILKKREARFHRSDRIRLQVMKTILLAAQNQRTR